MLTAPISAQIAQDHPELCARPDGYVPLPANIAASVTTTDATLTIHLSNSVKTIALPGVDEVRQVCPLAGNRLIVFGLLNDRSAYGIELVDAATGRDLDSFWARSPTMSPDQRFLAVRQFYPAQSDIAQSESYWLYDLSKDRVGNKIPGTDYGDMQALGYAIYPIRRKLPSDSQTLPSPETVHTFDGDAFHWATDSKSLLFADSTEKETDVVLVRVGSKGVTTYAYRPGRGVCSNLIEQADFEAGQASPGVEVKVTFKDGCAPIFLHPRDFKPAEIELYRPVQKRPSVQGK